MRRPRRQLVVLLAPQQCQSAVDSASVSATNMRRSRKPLWARSVHRGFESLPSAGTGERPAKRSCLSALPAPSIGGCRSARTRQSRRNRGVRALLRIAKSIARSARGRARRTPRRPTGGEGSSSSCPGVFDVSCGVTQFPEKAALLSALVVFTFFARFFFGGFRARADNWPAPLTRSAPPERAPPHQPPAP
jgi:hypothetical protein